VDRDQGVGWLIGLGALCIFGFSVAGCSKPESLSEEVGASSTPAAATEPYEPATAVAGSYVESRGDSECTQDCSGHDAGYQWAEEHGIDDADDCGGNSSSFIEGCQAYVEDNATETNVASDEP
jgi:hypothetical protein